ncbi:MAG: CheB methylesterase [Gemmatimonadetes bacterium]|nr:CheB methylesterase [Gemmatimonadota bacterium]
MSSSHDVVVIGGSAGAIEALRQILRTLPAELPARLFVTVHIPASVTSALPAVLARAGPLPARHPADGESTTPSMLYVAPPDHHLVVKRGAVRVVRGPRENGHRPAVDPLFRSAAAVYGPRVLAVVLSGNLDDGSAGARAVAAAGGTVLVQDPAEAVYSGMPSNALTSVPDALVLPLPALAERIVALVGERGEEEMIDHDAASRGSARGDDPRLDPVELDVEASEAFTRLGRSSGLTCPECHGGIFEVAGEEVGIPQYRCRVGHAFSAETLFAEQRASLESALWTALRALEESAELARRMSARARGRARERTAGILDRDARAYDQHASVIRDVLREAPFVHGGAGSAIAGVGETDA